MFICTVCIQDWEGPSVDLALKGLGRGRSGGSCEFCRKQDVCYDLYSGDPGWYRKEKKNLQSSS